MAVSGRRLLSLLGFALWLGSTALAIQGAERVSLDISGESETLRLHLASYTLTATKLGEPAIEGSQYLVVRGTLTNKNQEKGVDVPPLQKAFPLRLNGKDVIELDPLSEDTADPFWGPLILLPGEQYPVEMVFSIPATGVESAEIRHLTSAGTIKLFVIGTATPEPTEFLVDPITLGDARLAIGALDRHQSFGGRLAKSGHYFLHLQFWYTNLREAQPLETNIASMSALVEDGYYVYHSETLPGPGEALVVENYDAQVPGEGQMIFEVPEDHGHLELVHYTAAGPMRLTLTPEIEKLPPPKVIAGPTKQGRIEVSLFSQRATAEGLILDVGLRLNTDNPVADMSLDMGRGFELHDPSGKFIKSTPALPGIEHPIGEVVLRRDQLIRGELGFRGVEKLPGHVLLLPLASGPVSLALGQGSGVANPAAKPLTRTESPLESAVPLNGTEPVASSATSGQRPQVSADSTPTPKISTPVPARQSRPITPNESAPQPDIQSGIPEVLDTGTLSVNWKILRLYGVSGQSEPYRSELEGYVGDQFVKCLPVSKGFHKCVIDDVDLSELVLRNGAGRALPEAPKNLRAAESQARDKRIGVWQ